MEKKPLKCYRVFFSFDHPHSQKRSWSVAATDTTNAMDEARKSIKGLFPDRILCFHETVDLTDETL